MLALTLPMQFTFAALGEAGAGYDSTAADPRTGQYVDSAVLQIAADAQVTHESDRVRQILRNRAEALYEPTGGRDPLDSDVFDVAHYGLLWQPSEVLTLHTDATYAIGAPTLFFSRAGRADVSFARRGLAFPHQLVADYAVRQDAIIQPTEVDALQIEGIVAGRYRVTPQPRGQNMFTPAATLQWVHEFDEDNQGIAGIHGEYLDLELFRPVWLAQAYIGWSHYFDDSWQVLVEGGASLVEENLGEDRFDAQPFFRARVFKRFERQRLMLGASYAHTFGIVSATLGTGALDIANATAWFMPGGPRWLLFADAGLQRGQGYDPATLNPVDATFASAVVGARFTITPAIRAFARYDFQWQTDATYAATGAPDFIRHVVIAGIQVAWGTDVLAREQMMPIDELLALEHAEFGGDTVVIPPRSHHHDHEGSEQQQQHTPGDDNESDPMSGDPWQQQALPGSMDAPVPGDQTPPEPSVPIDPHAHEAPR